MVGKVIGSEGMNIADAHLERYSNLHIMDAHRNGVWLKGKFAILVHCSTEGEGDETVADDIDRQDRSLGDAG